MFILGVSLGWSGCLSFCGPILLPYIAATRNSWLRGLKVSLAFSLARIVPYVILSLISARLGYGLIRRFYATPARSIIYLVAGAFVALLGILITIGKPPHRKCCLPGKRPGREGLKEVTWLGILVGLAPCGPLAGLLIYIAFNARNFLQGALLGLAFGVGTLCSPLVLGGPAAAAAAGLLEKRPLVDKIFSRVCGVILVYWGAGMIFSAWPF